VPALSGIPVVIISIVAERHKGFALGAAAVMQKPIFLLESAGHSVMTATDAEAGLTLARDEQPQLILMDIQLPGMDGLEATRLLKLDDATRGIPVIALTALAMKGDEERIRAAGCDGYIAKPLVYKDFLAIVSARLVTPSTLGNLPA